MQKSKIKRLVENADGCRCNRFSVVIRSGQTSNCVARMRHFDLLEPKSFQEACQLLEGTEDTHPIGGGTALLILIKQGLVRPKNLINLRKLKGANAVTYDEQTGLRIGALATIHEVESSVIVREHFPVLAAACHEVANIRIRHLATMGGNLAHGDYQSDPPGVLVALGASVELQSTRGIRSMQLEDFLTGLYETALAPGEVLTAATVPAVQGRLFGRYVKFTTGSSEERPCAGITALLRVERDRPVEACLSIGAVQPVPLVIREPNPSMDVILDMASRASQDIDPLEDLRGSAAYKRHVVGVLSRRALEDVWESVVQ